MRRQVLALVVILVGAAVGVLLVDPELPEETPVAQPSENPKWKTAVAIERLSYLDYEYRINRYVNDSLSRQFRARVSHSDDTILEETTVGPEYAEYYTDGGQWIKTETGEWLYFGYTGYTEKMNPFRTRAFLASDPTSVEENASHVVVSYGTDSPNEMFHTEIGASYEDSMRNLTIWVNKSSGNVERIRFVTEQDGQRVRYSYEFEYHDVTINRPSELPPITLEEVLNDLTNAYAEDGPAGWETDS